MYLLFRDTQRDTSINSAHCLSTIMAKTGGAQQETGSFPFPGTICQYLETSLAVTVVVEDTTGM